MDVILLERVEKLGQMGDVVTVKNGYARNYLIPQNKALVATAANKAAFDARKAQLEAHNLEQKKEADAIALKVADAAPTLIRQAGESGQLYGSVNARDIADTLTADGITVKRQQVQLKQPIKTLGLHPVTIRLHPEVSVDVTANVARSEEEAKIQLETGAAVTGGPDDDDMEDASEALLAQADAVFEEGAAEDVVAEVEAEAAETDADAPAETEEEKA